MTKIAVDFGATCAPLSVQLHKQHVVLGSALIKRFQRDSDDITLLLIHGLLSASEGTRARRRLFKQIREETLRNAK